MRDLPEPRIVEYISSTMIVEKIVLVTGYVLASKSLSSDHQLRRYDSLFSKSESGIDLNIHDSCSETV